jgi:hypothetical protein
MEGVLQEYDQKVMQNMTYFLSPGQQTQEQNHQQMKEEYILFAEKPISTTGILLPDSLTLMRPLIDQAEKKDLKTIEIYKKMKSDKQEQLKIKGQSTV